MCQLWDKQKNYNKMENCFSGEKKKKRNTAKRDKRVEIEEYFACAHNIRNRTIQRPSLKASHRYTIIDYSLCIPWNYSRETEM